MNNDEKREFLSLKVASNSSIIYPQEKERLNDLKQQIPTFLFKYRKFDDFAFDMIENDYLYLAPAGSLDDPFDCLVNIDLHNIIEDEDGLLSNEAMNFILDIVFSHSNNKEIDKNGIIKGIDSCTENGELNHRKFVDLLDRDNELNNAQKHLLLNTLTNFQNVFKDKESDEIIKNLLVYHLKSKENCGICSLTTKKDNEAMWSLYCDRYSGYCIEYDFKSNDYVNRYLLPVIYEEEAENNLVKVMIKFVIETIIRQLTLGHVKNDLSGFSQLLCTKQKVWEYQDEWRIIGKAGQKIKEIKIKNIYLGFNVTKDNEEKILKLAKTKGFDVYKMNKPKGPKEITYTKII